MSYEVALPLDLLATLKSAFDKEAQKLCKSVAETLGLPKQVVLQRVLKTQQTASIKVYDVEYLQQCPVLNAKGPIHTRCRKTTLLGTERCLEHQVTSFQEPEIKNEFRLLLYGDLKFWLETETGFVYTSCGTIIGDYRDGIFTQLTFE